MTGTLSAYFRNTFAIATGQAEFFVALVQTGSVFVEFASSNPLIFLVITPQPDGTMLQTVNGEFVGTEQFVSVPEPASMVRLGSGLLGLTLLSRRPRA